MRVYLLVVPLLSATSAQAYDIHTKTPVMKLPGVHEAMVELAERCSASWPDSSTPPQRCWTSGALSLSFKSKPAAPNSLQEAVRWSDDPSRQGKSFNYPKLGLSLAKGCLNQLAVYKSFDEAGLLCSSHYGRLQFLHAMKGIDDRSAADVRQRVLAWARFAYETSMGSEAFLEQDICTATRNRVGLSDAFVPGRADRCTGVRGRWKTYPPYTVRTLFTLTCRRPWGSQTCGEALANDQGRAMARRAATGALLHLIQDSFSQAHTSRSTGAPVSEVGPFEAKVVCRPPTQFFDYQAQQRMDPDRHGYADLPPALDSSCASGSTSDPITASAALLWHQRHRKSADEFVGYLEQHVF